MGKIPVSAFRLMRKLVQALHEIFLTETQEDPDLDHMGEEVEGNQGPDLGKFDVAEVAQNLWTTDVAVDVLHHLGGGIQRDKGIDHDPTLDQNILGLLLGEEGREAYLRIEKANLIVIILIVGHCLSRLMCLR